MWKTYTTVVSRFNIRTCDSAKHANMLIKGFILLNLILLMLLMQYQCSLITNMLNNASYMNLKVKHLTNFKCNIGNEQLHTNT